MKNYLLCIFLILNFSLFAFAQVPLNTLLANGQCEAFDGQPSSCADFMVGDWSQVWTVNTYGVTQEYLNAQLFAPVKNASGVLITTLEFVNLMPYQCATAYLTLICPTAFKPCTVPPSGLGAPPAIPHPVCREVCDDVNVACAEFFASNGIASLNCSATNPQTGQPSYPPSSFNPFLGFFTCVIPPTYNSTPSYLCPDGTANIGPDHVDDTSLLPCAVPCHVKLPLPVDGHSNFYDQFVAVSVLGWISFVSINIAIVTYLIFEPLRRYPQRIILYTSFGLWFVHLGQVGSSFIGVNDLLCDGLYQFETNTGSWCKFASFCLFFGSMFTATIWAYLAFIIFWNVALLRVKDKRAQYGEYVIVPFALVWSLLETLILLWYPSEEATGGYLSGFPFCGLGPDADRNLFWGIFIAPLAFYLLLVVIFTTAAIVKIIITPTGDSVRKALGKRAPAQILLFVFVLTFMTVIIAIIAAQAYGQEFRPGIAESISNWYTCVYAGVIPWQDCPTGPVYVDNDIWWYHQIMVSSVGFFFSIIFVVLKGEVRALWVATLKGCAKGNFSIASTDIYSTTRGATAGSSRSGRGSSSR